MHKYKRVTNAIGALKLLAIKGVIFFGKFLYKLVNSICAGVCAGIDVDVDVDVCVGDCY